MTDLEVPTTTIPQGPRHDDTLLRLLIEEQRILISAEIERIEAEELAALENHHETQIFPDPPGTNLYVRFTAGAVNNTFGAWAEIVDTGANSLSDKFATQEGYLVSVIIEAVSSSDEVYLVEFSYGDDKTIFGRTRVQGGTNKTDTAVQERMRCLKIPAGETIYYRCACETADETADCHIRYYLLPEES